jgi:pimeloyl-ACP methyl ester carboxylesterase
MDNLPHIVLGDSRKPILVLLAGFPDNYSSGWGKSLSHFQESYFVISLCLPGFDNPNSNRPWGYDFDVLVDMMHSTIQAVIKRQCLEGIHQYYLLLHDWGSFIGQLYENKYSKHVKKVCLLDVGNFWDLKFSVYLSYQYLFGMSYVVSQIFGYNSGYLCLWTSLVLMVLFPFLGPTKGHYKEKTPRPLPEIRVDMCYPYYYMAIRSLLGDRPTYPSMCSCPLLFIYGGSNNIMLHDKLFLERIDRKPGSRHVYLKKSGHWPILAEPAIVMAEIKLFFS